MSTMSFHNTTSNHCEKQLNSDLNMPCLNHSNGQNLILTASDLRSPQAVSQEDSPGRKVVASYESA